MKVLVAMSGGVDSSVTAALLLEQGHEVVGATMKLWGGESDTGCCSVADVDDARRVAQQLDIAYHVFNFTEEFDKHVVDPYVNAHATGTTPNPCIECNRYLKFDRFLVRAQQLEFDAIATGHHARVVKNGERYELRRGADAAKDQSYVLHMLDQAQLSRTLLPVGEMTKDVVRSEAARLGLRTATKPDSQDVCFITSTGGREAFLGSRIPLHPGRVIEKSTGDVLGEVPAVELVAVGQRRGLIAGTDSRKRYVVDVDLPTQTVTVGDEADVFVTGHTLKQWTWTDGPIAVGTHVIVQISAHGKPIAATFTGDELIYNEPQRRTAPGQSIVLYDRDDIDAHVLGGAIVVA